LGAASPAPRPAVTALAQRAFRLGERASLLQAALDAERRAAREAHFAASAGAAAAAASACASAEANTCLARELKRLEREVAAAKEGTAPPAGTPGTQEDSSGSADDDVAALVEQLAALRACVEGLQAALVAESARADALDKALRSGAEASAAAAALDAAGDDDEMETPRAALAAAAAAMRGGEDSDIDEGWLLRTPPRPGVKP
jgi:hypothetical protein